MKNEMRPIHPGEILREEFLAPLDMSAHALTLGVSVPASTSTSSSCPRSKPAFLSQRPESDMQRHLGSWRPVRRKSSGGCSERGCLFSTVQRAPERVTWALL